MRRPLVAAGLLALALTPSAALNAADDPAPPPAIVTGLRLTNDRTVDCTSDDAILKGVLKDGMTEQQKAIALWRFYIQRNMHKEMSRTTDNGNTAELMTKTGYGLCGNWGHHLAQLAATGGMKASSVYLNGHVVAAIHYWGDWHMLDADMNAIYPKADGVLASPDEIRNLKDAAGQFLLRNGPPLKPYPWYLGPDSLKGVNGLYDKSAVNQPYAKRDYKWKYNLSLRPGQEISWSWYGDPDVGFVCLDHLPTEDCGKKLEFKTLREYLESDYDYYQREKGKPKWSWGNRRGGLRPNPLQTWNGTLGNGRVTFDMSQENGAYALQIVESSANLALKEGQLALINPAKEGSFVLNFTIPYSYGDAWIEKPLPGEGLKVEINTQGNDWSTVYPIDPAAQGGSLDDGVRIRLFDYVRGKDGFKLKFTLAPQSAPLLPIKAVGVFCHTYTALPGLVLGKNNISLEGVGKEQIKQPSLFAAFVYDQVNDKHELEQHIETREFRANGPVVVNCGDKHWPLMREIHVSFAPTIRMTPEEAKLHFSFSDATAIDPKNKSYERDWGALPWDWCYHGVNWWNDFERGDRQGWAGQLSTANTFGQSDLCLDNNLKTAAGKSQLKMIRSGAFLNRDTKFRCELFVKNAKELKVSSRHQDNNLYYGKSFTDLKDGQWQRIEFSFNDLVELKEGQNKLQNGDFLANLYLQVLPADGKTDAEVEFRIDNTICYDGELKHDPFTDPDAAKKALQDDPVWNAQPPVEK